MRILFLKNFVNKLYMKWKKKANLQKTTREETQSLYEAIIIFFSGKTCIFHAQRVYQCV